MLDQKRKQTWNTKVSLTKLSGGDDYHTWRFTMSSLLEMLGLEGRVEQPCKLDPAKPEDKAKLHKAKNILILNVEPLLYVHVQQLKQGRSGGSFRVCTRTAA